MNEKAIAKRTPNQALAPQQQAFVTVKQMLDSPMAQQKIREYARNVDPMQLVRVGKFMCARNETLGRCTGMSLLNALVECARLGLEPGGRAGGAYLVPYKRSFKRPDGTWEEVYEANMQTDYRGEIALLRRGKLIEDIWPRIVYANEEFREEAGTNPVLVHVPRKLDVQNRGEPIGAYAVIAFKSGLKKWFIIPKADIESQHRDRSQSYKQAAKSTYKKSSPWIDDEEAMWLKTAIRVAASKEPVDVVGRDYATWAEIEAARDRGEQPDTSLLLDETAEPTMPKSKVEDLADELAKDAAIEAEVTRGWSEEPPEDELHDT